MRKLFWLLIFAFVVIAIIFFPKESGNTCGFCAPNSTYLTKYNCYGFEYMQRQYCADCGNIYYCLGITGSTKRCFGLVQDQLVEKTC